MKAMKPSAKTFNGKHPRIEMSIHLSESRNMNKQRIGK
jgi:hypothetical protein